MGGLPRLFKYLPTADPPVWPSQPCSWNKPVGWWLSVEDAWERWSYASDFRVERVRWRRPVTFTPDVALFGPAERRPAPDAATVDLWASGAAV